LSLAFGLIVAAGRGRRFGGRKQFARLGGWPVWLHSALAFERCPSIAEYVIVASRTRLADVRRLAGQYRLGRLAAVLPGASERRASVRIGLDALPTRGIVAIHDGARPLLTPQMLSTGIKACRRNRAVTFGCPVTDTLKLVQGRRVTRTISRAHLVAVQTPQFFDLELLRRAHRSGRSASDDCALVERLGVRPVWLPGPHTNLKVTVREDLRICEALL
jgi:2-C-methyl-D-erythritol 4-phosphate cytidylyltransferase